MTKKLMVFLAIFIMSFGMVLTAHAATETLTGSEELPSTDPVGFTGDGTWSYTITIDETVDDDVQFYVEVYDADGSSFGANVSGSEWMAGSGTADFDNAWHDSDRTYSAGDTYVVEIIREGDTFEIMYYLDYNIVVNAGAYGTNLGDTVYMRVRVQTGTITVSEPVDRLVATEHFTIASVNVVELTQEEIIAGGVLDLSGSAVEAVYVDGTTEEYTLLPTDEVYEYNYSYGCGDAYDNFIGYYIDVDFCNSDGEVLYTGCYEPCEYIELYDDVSYAIATVGFYTIREQSYVIEQGECLSDSTIMIRKMTASDILNADATLLVQGEVYTSNIEVGGEWVWYSYTPEISGNYTLLTYDIVPDTDNSLWYYENRAESDVFMIDEDGNVVSVSGDYQYDEKYMRSVDLTAGVTYYFRTSAYYGRTTGTFEVELPERKVPKSISVKSLSKTEFVQFAEKFDFSGTVFEVTYTDGSTEEVTYAIAGKRTIDSWYNYYSFYVAESSTYWNEFEAGTYPVTFYTDSFGEIIADSSNTIEVLSIVDWEGLNAIEAVDEAVSVDVVSGTYVYFTFTPEVSGYYYFDTSVMVYYADEDSYFEGYASGTAPRYFINDINWTYAFQYSSGESVFLDSWATEEEPYIMQAGTTYYCEIWVDGYYVEDEDGNEEALDATLSVTAICTGEITEPCHVTDNIADELAEAIESISAGVRALQQLVFDMEDYSGELTLAADEEAMGENGDKVLLLQLTYGEDTDSESGLALTGLSMIDENGEITFTISSTATGVLVYGVNGDVTGDEDVDASDTLAILRGVSGRTSLDVVEEGFADVNLDGDVNSNDLLSVVKYVSGRTSALN